MNWKSWTNILIFMGVLWIVGSSFYYLCKIRGYCGGSSDKPVDINSLSNPFIRDKDEVSVKLEPPISYKIRTSEMKANPSDAISAKLMEILKDNPDKMLNVIGLYDPSKEENTTSSLGEARAEVIKSYFDNFGISPHSMANSLPESDKLTVDKKKQLVYNPVKLSIINKYYKIKDGDKVVAKLEALITFKKGTSALISSPNPDELVGLLTYLKQNPDKTLQLKGLYDNIKEKGNQYLGIERAEILAKYFKKNGLTSSQIITKSSIDTDLLIDEKKKLVYNPMEISFVKKSRGVLSEDLKNGFPFTYNFEFAKSNIRVNNTIKTLVKFLKDEAPKNKDMKILVDGHCCIIGTDSYNKKLSARRAKSFKDLFVKNGIPSNMHYYSLLWF